VQLRMCAVYYVICIKGPLYDSLTNYFDYTTATIAIPTPAPASVSTMSYLHAATSNAVHPHSGNGVLNPHATHGPTANEIRLQAKIDALKKIIAEKLSPVAAPPANMTEHDTATTTSTMTSAELVIRQSQFEITIQESIQQAISLQMTTMFEKLSKKMADSTTSINNEKKHQAPDASSPVKQSEVHPPPKIIRLRMQLKAKTNKLAKPNKLPTSDQLLFQTYHFHRTPSKSLSSITRPKRSTSVTIYFPYRIQPNISMQTNNPSVYPLFDGLQANPPAPRPSNVSPPLPQVAHTSSSTPCPTPTQSFSPTTILHTDSLPFTPPTFQRSSPASRPPPDDRVKVPLSIRPRSLFPPMPPTPPTPQPSPLSDLNPPLTVVNQYRRLFNYQPDRFKAKLSLTNFKANHPWGDDFSLDKPPNTFRLYYQNINGINLGDRRGDLASFLTTFSELQCDVVGLCKIKLDMSKYKVRQTISSAIRHQFKSARHAATTNPIPFETDYKPGGTMTMSFGPSVSRFQSKYEDPLGRWSTLLFNARKGMVVHFITVYQVVHKPLGGPYTAYQQQRSSLLLENRDLLPRQAFLMDFDKYLQSLAPKESQFVVMGDFNEVVGRNASGFAKITSSFQLVDVLGHFHSVQTEVPTYARGTKRLDYVFCSADLLPAVASCGAEPFNQHIFSGCALFLDWHEDILFGSKCPSLAPHAQRCFVAKHRPSVIKYIDELHKYSIDHNILERLGKLTDNPDPLIAEKVNRDITRGMLVAESRCRHPGSGPWSLC
jgi:hypothetical protein